MLQDKGGVEIGAVPSGVKTRDLTVDGGVWKDTPYFIAGIPDDAPNAIAFEAGKSLSGKLMALRPTQDGKHHYACLEDRKGNKYRVRAGTVLLGHLQALAIGTEVILTFNGKKESAKTGNTYNDFKVEVIEGSVN